MPKKLNLAGERFGRLMALRPEGKAHWLCKCVCGSRQKRIQTRHLRSGRSTSCGCLRKEAAAERRSAKLLGQRFGRLLVVGHEGKEGRNILWRCLCDCGKTAIRSSAKLISAEVKSCGCLRRERTRTHGRSGTVEYITWQRMIARCTRPSASSYRHYGGRGIKVCSRWMRFENFFADMGERPAGMSLDRIDNNGDYGPDNCRWATQKEQVNNRRNSKSVVLNGERMSLREAYYKLREMAEPN